MADLVHRDQADWGADDWRVFALHLLERGAALERELQRAEAERDAARQKLRRKPKAAPVRRGSQGQIVATLFTESGALKPARGRPAGIVAGKDSRTRAAEALHLLAVMKAAGRPVTQEEALLRWHEQHGSPNHRARCDSAAKKWMSRLSAKRKKRTPQVE